MGERIRRTSSLWDITESTDCDSWELTEIREPQLGWEVLLYNILWRVPLSFKKKKIKEGVIDILTFVFGIILSTILYKFMDFKDYIDPIYITGVDTTLHAPIASWSMPTVIAIVILGMV